MVNEVNGKGDGLKAWAWAWGQPSLMATADKAWGMGHGVADFGLFSIFAYYLT